MSVTTSSHEHVKDIRVLECKLEQKITISSLWVEDCVARNNDYSLKKGVIQKIRNQQSTARDGSIE